MNSKNAIINQVNNSVKGVLQMKKVYPASWYYQREIFRMISRFIGCLLVVVGLWYLVCAFVVIFG